MSHEYNRAIVCLRHRDVSSDAAGAALRTGAVHVRPGTITGRGQLLAAGQRLPVGLDTTVRPVAGADGVFEIEATTQADHRRLGLTWSPLASCAPSTLTVHGRLTREAAAG
jgi:hypothetical protein